MLKINMGAHKGCRKRNGTILGISLILIFSSGRMAQAAENAVKQAETAVIVGYSVSFIDAENANHLIFHTQTGKVLKELPERIFPEQTTGSDGHIWKSAVQSPQIFELYGTGTEKIYIKYERGGKVPEMGAEEDAVMLALRETPGTMETESMRQSAPYLGARMRGGIGQRFRSDRSKSVGKMRCQDPNLHSRSGMRRGMNFI